MIVDASPTSEGERSTNPQSTALVAELIANVKASGQLQVALPPFATTAMSSPTGETTLSKVREDFAATIGRSISLSRRRRAWMQIAQFGPLILIPLSIAAAAAAGAAADLAGRKVSTLIAFLGPDTTLRARPTGGTRQNPSGPLLNSEARTEGLLRRMGMYRPHTIRKRVNADSLAYGRKLVSTYIATALASRVRDTTVKFGALTRGDQARAMKIARDFANVSSAEVAASRRLVDSVWRGTPPGVSTPNVLVRPLATATLLAASACLLGVIVSLVVALLFRRGVLTRVFDVEFVLANGSRAGRMRLLVRQLVPSVAMAGALAVFWMIALDYENFSAPGYWVVAAACVLWVMYLVHSVVSPARSIADRIAGTYMVPA